MNGLRILGRWMRMVTIPNQSSVPKVRLAAQECRGDAATVLRFRPHQALELQANGTTCYWQAWTEFDKGGRMKASSYRDRVVDVAEELYKFSLLLRDFAPLLVDRYSERAERREKGRLLSQAEKEALFSMLQDAAPHSADPLRLLRGPCPAHSES